MTQPRFFRIGDMIRTVPAGVRPESLGIDTRSALEVPRPPEPGEHWVGPNRGYVLSRIKSDAHAAEESRAEWRRLQRHELATAIFLAVGAQLAAIEAQLATIEAARQAEAQQVAALEARLAAVEAQLVPVEET